MLLTALSKTILVKLNILGSLSAWVSPYDIAPSTADLARRRNVGMFIILVYCHKFV